MISTHNMSSNEKWALIDWIILYPLPAVSWTGDEWVELSEFKAKSI